MSLNWKLSKIADYKSVCWNADGTMSPVTHVVIMGMMAACLPAITERNWREVARRFAALQSLNGAFLTEWRTDETGRETRVDRPVTADDIQRHIGLETNATTESAARFDARMRRVADRMARNAE